MTSHWTDEQRGAFWAAHKRGDKLLYCLTDLNGLPSNGGKNDLPPAAPGVVHTTTSRSICSHGLHATSQPHRWAGSMVWIVALGPDAETDGDDKWCATRREVIGAIRPEEAVFHWGVALRAGRNDLRGADLTGVALTRADLRWADLREANLTGASLGGADLTGADLTGAYLTGAYLRWANLREANLTGASLGGADLTGADLTGAYLTGAYLHAHGWSIGSDGRAVRTPV